MVEKYINGTNINKTYQLSSVRLAHNQFYLANQGNAVISPGYLISP